MTRTVEEIARAAERKLFRTVVEIVADGPPGAAWNAVHEEDADIVGPIEAYGAKVRRAALLEAAAFVEGRMGPFMKRGEVFRELRSIAAALRQKAEEK